MTRSWLEHRWLAAETGEAPSAVQAACFVDLKRKHLRLKLRRVYVTLHDLTPYAPVLKTLDFQLLLGGDSDRATGGFSTAMLDFEPSSVDGWLARLVAAELGVEDNGFLHCAAREIMLKGARVSLSKLLRKKLEPEAGRPAHPASGGWITLRSASQRRFSADWPSDSDCLPSFGRC